MTTKKRVYKQQKIPRDEDNTKEVVQKLKAAIRRLESDKKKLLSEVKSLEEALNANIRFLKKESEGISLDSLIKAANKKLTLKEIKEDEKVQFKEVSEICNKCLSPEVSITFIQNVGTLYICKKCSDRRVVRNVVSG